MFFKYKNIVVCLFIMLPYFVLTATNEVTITNQASKFTGIQLIEQQQIDQYISHKQHPLNINNNNNLSQLQDSLSSSFSLRLQSYSTIDNTTNSKYIPQQKKSSCQLIVFVIYNNTFKIIIQGLQSQSSILNYVYVELKKLQLHFIEKVNINDKRVEIVVNIQEQKMRDGQVTEYVTVKGFNNNVTVKGLTNNYTENHQLKAQYQSHQMFAQQPVVFEQTRKVYLLQYSQNQWPNVTLPIRAIIITQLFAFLLIILLSHNIKYRRFLPFNFGILFAILYSLALLIIVYIDQIVQSISSNTSIQSLQVPKYMVSLMALFAITLYIMDLLNFWLQSKLVMLIISIIFSLVLIILDEFILEDYWYINDIIAILVSGCLIKFIVIRKMKTSIIPLAILWLFSILRQFIHVQSVAQQISLAIFPLHLQIPACLGDDEDGYSCSAFGSSKIIIIGLLVNYCVRVDLFISSRFYEILSLIIAFVSLLIELIFSIVWEQVPVMEYFSIAIFLPVTMLIMLAFAQKRGEWAIVWHGSFYDMAVNRTSIRKSQKQSISQIDSNFGQGLILSGSQAYSQGGSMIQKQCDKKLLK